MVVIEVKRNGEVIQDNQYPTVADARVKFNDWHAYFTEEGFNITVKPDGMPRPTRGQPRLTAWRGQGPSATVYDVWLLEFTNEVAK